MLIEYKGYRYTPERDCDECQKIFHFVNTPNGDRKSVDWSPYDYMGMEEFQMWVDLGFPERRGSSPLNRKDLQIIRSNFD